MSYKKSTMKKGLSYLCVCIVGGLLYVSLEIVFRGRTHWTMSIVGGLCAMLLYLIAVKTKEQIWKKWIMGGFCITTVEFLTGIIVNILLGWNVWSYAGEWANLFGQICVMFTLLWVILSIPGIWLMQVLNRRLFNQ